MRVPPDGRFDLDLGWGVPSPDPDVLPDPGDLLLGTARSEVIDGESPFAPHNLFF